MNRHKGLEWAAIQKKLEASTEKLWSLNEMETTGGVPDIVGFDKKTGEYIFYDCSAESPKESYYYQFIGIDKSNGDTVRILTPCQTADLNLKPNVGSYTPWDSTESIVNKALRQNGESDFISENSFVVFNKQNDILEKGNYKTAIGGLGFDNPTK